MSLLVAEPPRDLLLECSSAIGRWSPGHSRVARGQVAVRAPDGGHVRGRGRL